MKPLSGPISDRLCKQFKPDDPVWTPKRPADVQAKKQPVPKGVDGRKRGGRGK